MNTSYESERMLAEYLLFHFGKEEEILPPTRKWPTGMRESLGFPARTVGYFSQGIASRGLDLGCAVGRAAFEMARTCQQVIGIDFSQSFIEAAEGLRRGESIHYRRLEEADVSTALSAVPPPDIDLDRLRFRQADATNLPTDLGTFDRVHAANLLCRLREPQMLLAALPGLVRNGGELVLATPCTWLEEFTPRNQWPPGGTLAWMEGALDPHFKLVQTADEPFLIRETARKFQWTLSLVSVWRRLSEPAKAASLR